MASPIEPDQRGYSSVQHESVRREQHYEPRPGAAHDSWRVASNSFDSPRIAGEIIPKMRKFKDNGGGD